MKICVNDEVREVRTGTTVLSLVQELGLDPKVVAAQRNGVVLERDAFGSVVLEEDDALELLRLVGGG